MIFESFESGIKNIIYGNKAFKLKVSSYFFDFRVSSNCIDICELIKKCDNDSELYDNVCDVLVKDNNTDFLHFSLIMGLYIGCFNSYNYLYVSRDLRKKIVDSKPNRKDTLNFIFRNYSELLNYFNNRYGIDDIELKKIINKILFVVRDDSDNYLYNSDIVRDFFKILVIDSIYDFKINFNDSIILFDKLNENYKGKII